MEIVAIVVIIAVSALSQFFVVAIAFAIVDFVFSSLIWPLMSCRTLRSFPLEALDIVLDVRLSTFRDIA